MPRPTLTASDIMTCVTPPSLVDDGLSLSRRMPHAGHRDITSWLEGTQNSVAPPGIPLVTAASDTLCTGSFVDDGADMVYPAMPVIPGYGIVDRAFYSKGKPRKSTYDEDWTVEKKKALAGDMWRSLAKMRSVARVEIEDAGEPERREERKRRKGHRAGAVEEDGRVRLPKPLTWGTFVIEGTDGRVIVVDKDAEYDSGRPAEREEVATREREYEKKIAKRKANEAERKGREREKEVKARAATEARERREREEEERTKKRATSDDHKRTNGSRRCRRHRSSSRLLTPIPEADTSEESATGILSPTKFFMTGAREFSTHRATMLSAVPPSPTKPPPDAWPALQLSTIKSVPAAASAKSVTAFSTISSVSESDDSSVEQPSSVREAPAARLPSSASSGRYSDATFSTTSGAILPGSCGPMRSWASEDKHSEGSSPRRATTAGQSKAGSVDTRREDVVKHSPRSQTKRIAFDNASRGRLEDTWTEDVDKQPARAASRRRKSREASRTRSSGSWKRDVDVSELRMSRRATRSPTTSLGASNARTNDSWKRDKDEFESRVSRSKSRSPSKSLVASVSAWIQDDEKNTIRSVHSSSKSPTARASAASWNQMGHARRTPSVRSHNSAASRTLVVTPYSWRRQVEEISDHSTAGSNGSRSRGFSPIPSDDRGSDAEAVAKRDDDDTRSVKSHSTYRAPTVEDALDSEDGAQEWDSAWSVKDSHKGGDDADIGNDGVRVEGSVAGSARWSGKTGWGGDVETSGGVAEGAKWDGSAEGGRAKDDWKVSGGYDEGNDTWLNSEVGGVKYREAEWRREVPEGSWRDV